MTAIIIDDERDSVELLQLLLAKYFPQIVEVAAYTDSSKALTGLIHLKPDLVFLDINMPGMDGFELLQRCKPINFHVVFITAFDQYAVRAFRFNALDYLLKPVAVDDLQNAVRKLSSTAFPSTEQMEALRCELKARAPIRKIAIPSLSGIFFVSLDEIVYAESSNNYSKLILSTGAVHVISKTLKEVQDLLEESHFLRVHRQYIVNLNCVKQFNRNEGLLTMDNNKSLPVASTHKDRFLHQFSRL